MQTEIATELPSPPHHSGPARNREAGQGMVEYAFILLLIALVLILIVTLLGHQTQTLYSNVSNALNKGTN